jgi:hypothetical protein
VVHPVQFLTSISSDEKYADSVTQFIANAYFKSPDAVEEKRACLSKSSAEFILFSEGNYFIQHFPKILVQVFRTKSRPDLKDIGKVLKRIYGKCIDPSLSQAFINVIQKSTTECIDAIYVPLSIYLADFGRKNVVVASCSLRLARLDWSYGSSTAIDAKAFSLLASCTFYLLAIENLRKTHSDQNSQNSQNSSSTQCEAVFAQLLQEITTTELLSTTPHVYPYLVKNTVSEYSYVNLIGIFDQLYKDAERRSHILRLAEMFMERFSLATQLYILLTFNVPNELRALVHIQFMAKLKEQSKSLDPSPFNRQNLSNMPSGSAKTQSYPTQSQDCSCLFDPA